MASFPCPREQVAASALLLLSTTTPRSVFHSMCDFDFHLEDSIEVASKIWNCRESSELSVSRPIVSSESSDLSVEETSPPPPRIAEFAPGLSEMNLKAVRKTRSKIQKSTGRWKFSSGENIMTSSGSVSTESSCLTTGCSADSSARSRGHVTKEVHEEQRRKHIGSNHIRRRAQGILNLLSGRCYSEVIIRQLLGDSPDTSKALRILLKLEHVKRSGTGGRQDPYIYTKA